MYKLSVPLEAQKKSSTCWHASALMIWRYSQMQTGRSGPMNSLGSKWVKNEPVFPAEFIHLAEKTGLMGIPSATKTHTASALEALLRDWGPLWCAGFWYGPGHVIVLTGIQNNTVYINDPDGGKSKQGTIDWFNNKLASNLIGCLMAKDSKAY